MKQQGKSMIGQVLRISLGCAVFTAADAYQAAKGIHWFRSAHPAEDVVGWIREQASGAQLAAKLALSRLLPHNHLQSNLEHSSERHTVKHHTFPQEWHRKFTNHELLQSAEQASLWEEDVRQAMRHVWQNYRAFAWGDDEIRPQTGKPGRDWGKIGLTLIDSLSTLWIMGLYGEFDEAEQWVAKTLNFDSVSRPASFFELTIRGLGGLASAHALSGRPSFLQKATQLADRLLVAFDTPSGIPAPQVNLKERTTANGWAFGNILAESVSHLLEFHYMTLATGDAKYAQKADLAMQQVLAREHGSGLLPVVLNGPDKETNLVSLGGLGDSYYEYLLKAYIQGAGVHTDLKDAWKRAMGQVHKRLLKRTKAGLTYLVQEFKGRTLHKMDHLSCFAGGMLIYGSRMLPESEVDPWWEQIAEQLTNTCMEMYRRQPSHLAPDMVQFHPTPVNGQDMEAWDGSQPYLLRPEAAESIFYMFYFTGDPKYRAMAGEIWEAIQKHCRSEHGYSSVQDVTKRYPKQTDHMETFFLSETLKYLYLTFVPNPHEVLDLNKFVLNTEGHPLPIQMRTPMLKEANASNTQRSLLLKRTM